ncbi:hypothetical protein [Pareuzebyella sediminis]|uniref:hypothetical protein n=1 Tax=Pareuzebyella sediminis TaxID=2607998 RepID=UPI0011EC3BA8|nr:hypothetical protein [Pareuzebyella sediminis]
MKTYNLIYAATVLFVLGCSKSSDVPENNPEERTLESGYTLLVTKNNLLKNLFLQTEGQDLAISTASGTFEDQSLPELTFEDGQVLSILHRKTDCSITVTIQDFEADSLKTYSVFDDLNACAVTTKAIAQMPGKLFIAYELEVTSKVNDYYVRMIDLTEPEISHIDASISLRPLQLAIANNRLFILTSDDEVTGENGISVFDVQTKALLYEELIGFDAHRIFRNPEGNIIIGYDQLHTTLNSVTMSKTYTNYGETALPNFIASKATHFDSSGKMYYEMPTESFSSYPVISAIYDFKINTLTLYAFENFLTEAQRNFEFDIEKTTMVRYDENNNLLIIGYKKVNGSEQGGIMRVKPAPEPKFIDNLDVDGIPYALYFK